MLVFIAHACGQPKVTDCGICGVAFLSLHHACALRICHYLLWYAIALDSQHCGLVVRVPGYTSRGPGSTPGFNTFPEK
jgi:hypothetical protein